MRIKRLVAHKFWILESDVVTRKRPIDEAIDDMSKDKIRKRVEVSKYVETYRFVIANWSRKLSRLCKSH